MPMCNSIWISISIHKIFIFMHTLCARDAYLNMKAEEFTLSLSSAFKESPNFVNDKPKVSSMVWINNIWNIDVMFNGKRKKFYQENNPIHQILYLGVVILIFTLARLHWQYLSFSV